MIHQELCSSIIQQRIIAANYVSYDHISLIFWPYKCVCYIFTAGPLGAYCTVIKPTWLTGATYDGKEDVNGLNCNVWNQTGAVAMDYWAQDDNNIPCAYYENVSDSGELFWHQLNFNQSSYIIGEPDASIFNVPDDCHRVCNNSFPMVNTSKPYIEKFIQFIHFIHDKIGKIGVY